MNGSFDKDGKELTLHEMFNVWDRKEFAYDEISKDLLLAAEGCEVSKLFQNATVCPVNNGSCDCYFTVKVSGYNPDLGHKYHEITICPLGAKSYERCSLNK
jgi:hypothetical protein